MLRRVGRMPIRTRLLLGLGVPLLAFLSVDAVFTYRAALQTAQVAYDRLLVTSAHALGDLIRLDRGQLQITLPHAALEIYDATPAWTRDTNGPGHSRMLYRVGFVGGDYLAGDADLQPYTGRPAPHPLYQSMIALYDGDKNGEPMRMAALLQPVETFEGLRTVVVQVAESSAYRQRLSDTILRDTALRRSALLAVLLALVWAVATVALKPLRRFARQLDARPARDLNPIEMPLPPPELAPVIAGFNGLLSRLRTAQAQQQRLVADASHQLRTPLTVLQLQADAGLHGDMPAEEALANVASTTRRATRLVQQLLSLARAQQTEAVDDVEVFDVRLLAQDLALELSPLFAGRHLDFHLDGDSRMAVGQPWMLREVLQNLISNAIEFTPAGSSLGVVIGCTDAGNGSAGNDVMLTVWDRGPGLPESMREQVFTPFATDRPTRGAGLGLSICRDLVRQLRGTIELHNRLEAGRIVGLDAVVRLPADGA